MSFRVLWFVVAGFVIGFTTSTLWEWLYYRRKRLAMLADHSEFGRDAGRQPHAATHADETATSDATEWRSPFYRSPGVFLESEQPEADATFTGTAFAPSAAPWVAPPPATSYAATLDPAENDGPVFPGRPYRAAMGENSAATSAPGTTTESLPPVNTRPPASSLTGDELAAADQVKAAPVAAESTRDATRPFAPSTLGLRSAYANVIIVDRVTSDGGQRKDATPAEETAGAPMPDHVAAAPFTTNTEDHATDKVADDEADEAANEETDDEADEAAVDFNVVDLTATAFVAVAPQTVSPTPLAKQPIADPAQPAHTLQRNATDPLISEPTAQRPPERTPRERPDDYPDDLALIKGIGEAYKRRLYATGIYTWRQVAESDLDSLRRITRAKPNADIQSWQTQARELAEKYQRWEAHFAGPLDDLTQIDGIGAITADMLYKAGICTYAALAQTSPDELARIVPAPTVGNENDFDGWIREGARLDGVKRKNQGLLS